MNKEEKLNMSAVFNDYKSYVPVMHNYKQTPKILRIAFIGTQGSGKTTAVYSLAAGLKTLGIHVKIISEAAENCPYEINKNSTSESQEWMIVSQITNELTALATFPKGVIICDRTPFDSLVYSRYNNLILDDSLTQYALNYMKRYDIIFYQDSKGGHLDDNGIRSTDKKFQTAIERRFELMLHTYGIRVVQSKKPLQEVLHRWNK